MHECGASRSPLEDLLLRLCLMDFSMTYMSILENIADAHFRSVVVTSMLFQVAGADLSCSLEYRFVCRARPMYSRSSFARG